MSSKKTINELVSAHQSTGKSYPRPRDICDECKGAIVLKWGTKVTKAYWSHLSGSKCNIKNPGESAAHRLAKKLIVKKLSEGYLFMFDRHCNKCNINIREEMPKNSITFIEEYYLSSQEGKIIFDVAGLSQSNEIVFGIEVYWTHKTIGRAEYLRNGVPWYEIKADEIINKLDVIDSNKTIIFTDQRLFNGCGIGNCIFEVKTLPPLEVKPPPIPEVKPPPILEVKPPPILEVKPPPILEVKPSPIPEVKPPLVPEVKSISLPENDEFIPIPAEMEPIDTFLDKLKTKMPYYRPAFIIKAYANESRKLVEIAIKGKYKADILIPEGWHQDYDENDYTPQQLKQFNEIWKLIIKYKLCIRCGGRSSIISYKKPFCVCCFMGILENDENYSEIAKEEEWIEDDRKMRLRKALFWIKDVPGNWSYGMPCSFCKKDYSDERDEHQEYWDPGCNFVKIDLWWFGDKKCFCTICLEIELRKRGLVQ